MSDLQTSLLAIGGIVVVGVVAFNWLQERGFRRRTERAFSNKHDDVLLRDAEQTAAEEVPIDQGESAAPIALPQDESYGKYSEQQVGSDAPKIDSRCDPVIDYVIELTAPAPISAAAILDLLRDTKEIGKPASSIGLNAESKQWEEVALNPTGLYKTLKVAIQLVNRNGPISAVQLSKFRDVVKNLAVQTGMEINLPDSQAALSQALKLDNFCAEVDVSIVFNVISRSGTSFAATKIRALAESMGFELESDGEFYYYDDHEHTLFLLSNSEPAKFLPENIKSISTKCFTLTFEVPVVTNGLRVFDQLVQNAKSFTTSLGGLLVDDNYVPLNDQGIEKIRHQLKKIYAAMESHQTYPGSIRAVRLFS